MNNITRCLFLFILFAFISRPESLHYELDDYGTRDIQIEIKGEVSDPGIITVDAYSTVDDVLKMIDLSEDADLSKVNRTAILKDQDVLVIPGKSDSALLVSINTADIDELTLVPNIGKVTAENIIAYRNQNGLFQSIDDLVKVKGIGAKTLEKIRKYLTL